jgi:hypothetical protein
MFGGPFRDEIRCGRRQRDQMTACVYFYVPAIKLPDGDFEDLAASDCPSVPILATNACHANESGRILISQPIEISKSRI